MKSHFVLFLLTYCSLISAQENNPLLADPTIFEDNGTYYLYGTKGNTEIEGEGFLVYSSKDLKTWNGPVGASNGFAFKKGDGYGTKGFWAPQVFKYKNKFYMAYTANENIAIASAESPLGPFKNNGDKIQSTVKQIDPFIFFDNGKIYLYYVRLDEGNRIFVAELSEDMSTIKPNTLTECINVSETWENTTNASWAVTEGPTVLKKGGKYFLIYSANDFRNKDYAVGYAISKSPYGPWKKSKNSPFISEKLLHYPGTGHGDVFYDSEGNMYYVFHTHYSEKEVSPRKTAYIPINIKREKLKITKHKSIIWLSLYKI